MSDPPHFAPLGDSALTIRFGRGIDPRLNARVTAAAYGIRELALPGVLDVVPAYDSLAVFFDPLALDPRLLEERLRGAIGQGNSAAPGVGTGRTHLVPVRYDGPDLEWVAAQVGLSRDEVIRRHAEPTYQVYFLGFVPGFGYLGPLDPSLVLRRRSEPRRRVPPGSVAIAGAQTGIYPLETPGGWHLLGRTDLVLFDAQREPPSLFAPGDHVHFVPVAS